MSLIVFSLPLPSPDSVDIQLAHPDDDVSPPTALSQTTINALQNTSNVFISLYRIEFVITIIYINLFP